VSLVPEPVAAAQYFIGVLRHRVPPGRALVVFDLGAGTLDVAVVRHEGNAFQVIGSGGREDLGGLDIDAALVDHLGTVLSRTAPELWTRLQHPATGRDRRDRWLFWGDVRGAKEMLSRTSMAPVPVPGSENSVHVTREELEHAVRPMLQSAAMQTLEVIRSSGISPSDLSGVLLVGGSSRVPLMGRLLHTELGIPPVVLEQPELPVAEGAVIDPFQPEPDEAAGQSSFALPPYVTEPVTPTSGGPVAPISGVPISALPVSPPYAVAPVSATPAPVAARGTAGVPPPPVQPAPPREEAPREHPPPGRPPGRWSRRLVVTASVAAVLAVLIGTGTAWALISNRHRATAGGPSAGPGHTASAGTASSSAPRSGPWKSLAKLPVQLEGAAVTAYQNKVWVAGGLLNDGPRTKLTSTYLYDPATDRWSTGPVLPKAVSHAALVATSHGLYFMGGWILEGGSKQVLRLDEKTNKWVQDTPMPDTRVGGAAAWDGTRIVYAGGTRNDQSPGNEVWAFQDSRWTEIGKLKQGRQKLAATSDGAGAVWVLSGGDQVSHQKFGYVETITGNQIVEDESQPAPKVDGGAALRINGATCELGGREVNQGPYSGWWCDHDGVDDTLPALNPARAGLGVALIGRTVYVVGGYGDGFDGTDRVEAFTLAAPG
jgi:hypothetical protein